MHPPQNDPPHDAPEPPHRAPKGLGMAIYVVDFCYTYYVTTRKSYHEDWLMRCQISQYFITHMLLDRSISSEIKACITRRDIRLTGFKGEIGLRRFTPKVAPFLARQFYLVNSMNRLLLVYREDFVRGFFQLDAVRFI